MFEVVKGYAEMYEADEEGNLANPDAKLAVTAVDNKTLTVTLNNAVAYWNELLAFPTYLPVREDVVASEAWATDPSSYVCNGLYVMSSWEHNSKITLTKNPNYFKADTVTMDVLECYLSDDDNNMLANFENGAWQLIDSVPTSEIASLKEKYSTEFVVASQIGTYYACWSVNKEILPASCKLTGAKAEAARAEIRNALGLLLDRNYIVNEIGQAGQVPASSFVAMGMTDADGSDEFDGYWNTSEDAYMDNWDAAMASLKKYYAYDEATGMFTDVPSLDYLYNNGGGHQAIGEYIQGVLAGVGITVNLSNQEWNTFLNTRKNGDCFMARNGWLADYNDPICFLDMWVSNSGNNDIQYGKDAHAGLAMYSLDRPPTAWMCRWKMATWAQTYDVLINAIKSRTDNANRYAMMHVAEDMLMTTGCVVSLYFYTDIYMLDDSVEGFYSTPLGLQVLHALHGEQVSSARQAAQAALAFPQSSRLVQGGSFFWQRSVFPFPKMAAEFKLKAA